MLFSESFKDYKFQWQHECYYSEPFTWKSSYYNLLNLIEKQARLFWGTQLELG